MHAACRPAALAGLLAVSVLLAVTLLASAPSAAAAPAAAPAQDIERAMEALKYLQELDRYYSQVARPRRPSPSPGPPAWTTRLGGLAPELTASCGGSPRSEFVRSADTFKKDNMYLKMLQLQTLDRIYAPRTRPRFGKRAEPRPFSDDSLEDANSGEKLWRRFSRRR